MAKNKVTQLEQKKLDLQKELAEIEDALDKSIGKVKEEVTTSLNPKRIIREYPLPALAASIALGLLLGRNRKKGTISYQEERAKEKKKSAIANEIKYALTRKGIHLMLDFLDQKISEMKKRDHTRR